MEPDSVNIPGNHGVLRAIYLVPVVAITLGAAGLAQMLRRWRRGGSAADTSGGAVGQTATRRDGYDARLDDELKDLDV